RRNTEAEERERRLGEDDRAESDRGQDDDRGRDVRQHVADDDARVAAADGAGGLDELVLHHAERGATDDTRVGGGGYDGGGEDEVQPGGAQHGHHRENDDEVGEREPRVDHPLQREIPHTTEVRARHADGGGDHDGQRDGGESHRDRHARAVHDAAPHVAAEV